MKPGLFAISIMWNGGFHHFHKYFSTEAVALQAAHKHAEVLAGKIKGKPGARPTVYVWAMCAEVKK